MSILPKSALAAAAVLALSLNVAAVAQTATPAAPTTTPGLGPGPLTPASGAAARSMAGSSKLSGGDRSFVEKAAVGGMAEVALGKMAQEKGASDAVRQFGAHMVEDHTKANNELMQIATSKGATPPADIDRKHKAVADKLSKLSGAAFDREYVKTMVAGHKETAALMDKQAKSGQDADLKAFAAKTLPVVQAHLKMVTAIDGSMKGMKAGSTADSMAK